MSEKVDNTIIVGSSVILKSGGPDMTVISVTKDGRKCKCTWYDDTTHKYSTHIFSAACLTMKSATC